MRNALAVMDQDQVWNLLNDRYFDAWLRADPSDWPRIALKLEMITDLREELRKIVNSGDIDNAGSPSAK